MSAMPDIPLKNGQVATYMSTRMALIKEIDPEKPTSVHIYGAPCPIPSCGERNPVYSYDGKMFATFQVSCRRCGIYYRPVVDPAFAAGGDSAINKMNQT